GGTARTARPADPRADRTRAATSDTGTPRPRRRGPGRPPAPARPAHAGGGRSALCRRGLVGTGRRATPLVRRTVRRPPGDSGVLRGPHLVGGRRGRGPTARRARRAAARRPARGVR